jgi:heptosyltransferase-1
MPAVFALARALRPATRIGWVIEEPFAELVSRVAPVDRVFRVSTRRWRRSLLGADTRGALAALRRELRTFGRGETAVDFQGLVKSALLGTLAGTSRRFGFAPHAVRERLAALLYTERIEVDTSSHVVDWNLALARAAGALSAHAPRPDYSAFPADPDGSLEWARTSRPVILIPGAGRPSKQWNIDSYRLLAERLAKLLRSEPVVVWGPGERQLAEGVSQGGVARVAPPTDLRQLAFLLQHSRLVVAGDTGPLHLADALGTPVVGLFGPTSPRRNGPYGQPDGVVESYSSTGAMHSIPVDAVFEKVREVLGA